MKFSERYTIIPGFPPADNAAGVDSESINMGLVHSVMAIIALGNVSVADFVLKAYAGATAGTKTTALTFRYRYSSAAALAATADVLGAWATSAALTVGNATKDNFVLIIEIESGDMPEGKPWLTLEDAAGATVQLSSCVFIADPRQPNVTVIGA